MLRQKQIEKIVSLIAVKFKVAQIKQEEIFRKQLFNIFRRYYINLVGELSSAGFFKDVATNATFYRASYEVNPELDSDKSGHIKQFAQEHIDRMLKPLINLINQMPEHRRIVDENNLKMYNIAGLGAAVATVFQTKAYSKKVRKALDDELNDFDIVIDPGGANATVGDTFVDFFIRDENISNTVKARSQNINFVTDLDYKTITNIMIQEAYVNGSNTRKIAREFERSLNNVSERRSNLIARTEMNIVQNEATIEFGKKVGMRMKRWLSLGDHLVRRQHAENEIVGPVPFEDTFSSASEYSPSRCALPYNCRCTMLLMNNPKEDIVNSYWNGSQLVQTEVA